MIPMRQAFNRADVNSRLHVLRNGTQALGCLKGEVAYGDRSTFSLIARIAP